MLIISVVIGLIFLMYIYFMKKLSNAGINTALVGREIPPT